MNGEIRGHKATGSQVLFVVIFIGLMVVPVIIGSRDINWFSSDDLRSSLVFAVGRIFALWAIILALLQGPTTARFSLLDKAFGYDQLIKFHRCTGFAALSLAFLHPMVFVASGFGFTGSDDFLNWPVLLGGITLLGLWFIVISSKYRRFLLIRWKVWRRLHTIAGPVVFIAFLHMFAMSPTLHSEWFLLVWVVLFSIIITALSWTKIIRPIIKAKQCLYSVKTVKAVAEDITEVTLCRANGKQPFRYMPGQFMFIRFKGSAVCAEEHPFTISTSPENTSDIQFAAKKCGDFSNQLDQLKSGDSAVISGPHGGFTPWRFGFVDNLILVAGGIGITPMLSILRTLALQESKLQVTLFWSNRTYEDLPYKDEVSRLEKRCSKLTVTHIVTRGGDSPYYLRGRLNESAINKVCPDWRIGTHVMLCGPEAMTGDLWKAFRKRGYPKRMIHRELFTL